ncbi:MAG: SDR family oxidoreductase [Candidatus Hydrogenedentota bacterium]|nr:MAG: SDR family oxidoreductase [Candidatus Hydrogenedentota bacterium]
MSGRLKDKVAIVVGAGCTPGDTMGNGRATAILFAREGAAVMLVDRRRESAEETRQMIDGEGGTSFAFEADITRAEECKRMADKCIETYGRIDILHNNVGIGEGGGPVELTEEDWDKVVDTNLKSMFLTCKYVLPHMEKQGSGAIVNISSMAAVRFAPYPMLPYSASKAGVNALTRSVAMQYAHQGIRSNAIMPGLINTPMAIEGISERLGIEKEDLIRMRDAAVPMNHMGEAWDVAYAALFLASDEAKYVTGVVLPVDGGLSCKG